MNKILLIEHQYLHFERIKKQLEVNGFLVYPICNNEDNHGIEEYKLFINPVRISLNPRYSYQLRLEALKKVESYISITNFDLIIMEYKLTSIHTSETGIDLAARLQENHTYIPILFFSKTEINHINVVRSLGILRPPFKWLNKGFANDIILSDEYFHEVVLPTVRLLISQSKYEKLKVTLLDIIYSPIISELLTPAERDFFLAQIKSTTDFSNDLFTSVSGFSSSILLKTKREVLQFLDYLKKYLIENKNSS